ncbi:MAG: adenine deaminase, partial [Deltaproteobacteria bacterium]|nr:adenine deaminase [Deltaproteobacteria bacterium]
MSFFSAMPNRATIRKLIATALGREAADLAIINARLVNVFTAEIIPESTITVREGKIAGIGPAPAGAVTARTQIIDAGHDFVLPGYIETHT